MSSLAAFNRSDALGAPAPHHHVDAAIPGEGVSRDPLVSIIIPCFNGEAYLAEAIESCLAQSYRRIEVLVVDDGSTDRSAEIAQSFPIRYIGQENRGLSRSRNRGIWESHGSYLVFLDADDRLLPTAVEAGLNVLIERPECAMAVGDHLFVDANGSYRANSKKQCLPSSHYEALLISNFIEMISSVLFRRDVFDSVGAFDAELRVAEDYEMYLRIAREFPVCSHPAVVAEYRIHGSNTSHNSELMLTVTLDVLKRQARYSVGDLRRLFAFVQGMRSWRTKYGRQLTTELALSCAPRPIKSLRRKILLLVDHYPQGLLVLLLLRWMPKLGQHRRERATGALSPALSPFRFR